MCNHRRPAHVVSAKLTHRVFSRCLLGLAFCYALAPPSADGQILEGIATDATVGEVMTHAEKSVQAIIDNAAAEADYLRQQIGLEALIALQTLRGILTEQQDVLWANADITLHNSVREIDHLLASTQDRVLEIEDIAYLDLSRLLNRIPLLPREAPLRRIEGASLYFDDQGTYSFRLVGAAFDPTALLTVQVAGKDLPATGLDASQANNLVVSVPVADLNSKFLQDDVALIPLDVAIERRQARGLSRILPWNWFSPYEITESWRYDLSLRLLPKTAAPGYLLTEYRTTKIAGEETWSDWGPSVRVRRAGRDCSRSESCANSKELCVAIPADAELVFKGEIPVVGREKRGCGAWCDWTGHPIVRSGRVCQRFKNWRKSRDGHASLRVRYKPLSDGVQAHALRLEPVASANGPVESLAFGRLYHATFSEQYASFDLAITLFNGETLVVTPSQSASGRAGIAKYSLENLGGSGHRLVLQLLAPG